MSVVCKASQHVRGIARQAIKCMGLQGKQYVRACCKASKVQARSRVILGLCTHVDAERQVK